jgi:sarcosine oxidase subunit beta
VRHLKGRLVNGDELPPLSAYFSERDDEMEVREADVVIIGGGINSCSMAYELAKKGRSVIVLERGRVGEEASGRNGGGVRQQNRHPAELPLAMEAIKIWATMHEELEWDVEYRRGGNLRLVTSQQEYETFHTKPEWERNMGLDVEFLTPEETRAVAPAISRDVELLGATYCPTDGTANPLLVTKAIARAARRLEVEIREHEPVERLQVQDGRMVAAFTSRGEYRAPVFVNAAGAWARALCNKIGLDFPVQIKKAQLFVTEPLPLLINEFISFDIGYVRQAVNGGVHIGTRSQPVENFDKSTTLPAFKEAGWRTPQIFPLLKETSIVRSWAGITHWTPDEIPIIDRAPNVEGLFLTAGFSGHGFCLGPIVGRLMAEWIADGKSSMDLYAFRWTRFDNIYLEEHSKE